MSAHGTAAQLERFRRLCQLLLLLCQAPRGGFSREELLARVPGYRGSEAAARKKFERDKAFLRQLGLGLTVGAEHGDNKLSRYRIDLAQLASEQQFSRAELELLEQAAAAVEPSAFADQERAFGIYLKIFARAPERGRMLRLQVLSGSGGGEALRALDAAIRDGRSVTFAYQKPGGEPEQREIAPLLLHLHESSWHVYGWDHARGAVRQFLLERIVGEVAASARPVTADMLAAGSTAIRRFFNFAESRTALLAVREGSEEERVFVARAVDEAPVVAGELAARVPPGYRLLTVPLYDAHLLGRELAGSWGAALPVAPTELVQVVRETLAAVREQHEGGAAA